MYSILIENSFGKRLCASQSLSMAAAIRKKKVKLKPKTKHFELHLRVFVVVEDQTKIDQTQQFANFIGIVAAFECSWLASHA